MEERKLMWNRCLLCSCPVTTTLQRSSYKMSVFLRSDSCKVIFKYLFGDHKLEKKLSREFFEFVEKGLGSGERLFCGSCEEISNSVKDLQEVLEKIQMQIVDKVVTMKKTVVRNSRLYGGNLEVNKDWEEFEDRVKHEEETGEEFKEERMFLEMMHEFQSFIFESDDTHVHIPLVYIRKLTGGNWPSDFPVKITVPTDIKEEPAVHFERDEDEDSAEDFFPQDYLSVALSNDDDDDYLHNKHSDVKKNKVQRRQRNPSSKPSTKRHPKKTSRAGSSKPVKLLKPSAQTPNKYTKAQKLRKQMEKEDGTPKFNRGRRIWQCEQCNYNTERIPTMNSHLQKHETCEKLYKCPDCDEAFTLRLFLKLHLLLHLRSKPCDVCGNRVVESELESHLKTHSNKVFSCIYCNKIFGTFTSLMYHRLSAKRNHPGSTLKCELCPSSEAGEYNFETELPKHLSEFHGLKDIDFKCDVDPCSKTFLYPNALKTHRLWHQRRNPCQQCEKGFKTGFELKQHVQCWHPSEKTELKPKSKFKCTICEEKFDKEMDRNRHQFETHNCPKFKCDLCPDKEFFHKSGILWHERSYHGIGKALPVLQCPHCEKTCFNKISLEKHLGQHVQSREFTCEICGFATKTLVLLNRHSRIHNRKPENMLECGFCSKKFFRKASLTTHLRIHTNEKPFVCDICGKGFAMKKNMNTHRKTHEEKISK